MKASPLIVPVLLAVGCMRASLPAPVVPLAATDGSRFAPQPERPSFEPALAPHVDSFQLENGLRVYVLERPEQPWVSIRYAMQNAAEDGTLADLGVSTLVLGLSARRDPAWVVNHGDKQPALILGHVDHVGGYLVTGAELGDLERTLAELAAVVRTPQISEENVRSEMFAQMDEIDASAYETNELARCHARRILYGNEHPLGQTLLGRLDKLGRQKLDQLAAHHRLMFAPQTSALVVVGGAALSSVRELAARYFNEVQNSPGTPLRRLSLGELPKRNVRALLTPGKLAFLVESFRAPAASDPDRPAFELLQLVAAELFSSRINTALREQAGHTYGVQSRYEARVQSGTWLLEAAVDPDDLRNALETIDRELARLRGEPLTVSELERARTQLRERRRAKLADAAGAADLITDAFLLSDLNAPLDLESDWNRYYTQLAKVRPADVRQLAARSLSSEGRGVVVAGDLSHFLGGLKRWNREVDLFIPERLASELEQQGAVRRETTDD